MKNVTRALCLMAVSAVAMPAWAQTSGTDKPADKPADKLVANTVSVTGCLREASDQPNLFVLVATAPDASGTMGSKETTATTSSTKTAAMYRLVSGAGEDLKKHVGHKVQATGKVREDKSASSGSTAKPMGSPTSADAKSAPELSVTSFKHIAESCSN